MAMKRFTKKFGTNPIRLSYCNLDKARAITPGAKEKYSCVLLIPKTDKATIDGLKQTMKEVYQNNPQIFEGYDLKSLVRIYDGDGSSPKGKKYDANYAGMWVVNASNSLKPKLLMPDGSEVLDVAGELYSGVWAKVGITIFPYSNSGNVGLGVSLDLIKKHHDDEPFGGVAREEDYFGKSSDDDEELF